MAPNSSDWGHFRRKGRSTSHYFLKHHFQQTSTISESAPSTATATAVISHIGEVGVASLTRICVEDLPLIPNSVEVWHIFQVRRSDQFARCMLRCHPPLHLYQSVHDLCKSRAFNSIRLWIWKKLLTHIFCIIKKIDECKDFKLLILRSLCKKKKSSHKGYWLLVT